MSTTTLTFFCLLDGGATSNLFPPSTSPTTTIGELKRLIKDGNAIDFVDVDAKDLALCRVSLRISDDDDGEETPISLDTLADKKKLRPTSDLTDLFAIPLPRKTIHIVTQRATYPHPETAALCKQLSDMTH
ncbi:hypothetical protein BGZ94_000117 [Podila epigama]|nr:hypothetical protein BGZ94_000117 [Podila epigama]